MDDGNAKTPATLEELPLMLTVEEAADVLRISRFSAFRAVKRGELPAVRIGRRLIVPRGRLLEMLGETERQAA